MKKLISWIKPLFLHVRWKLPFTFLCWYRELNAHCSQCCFILSDWILYFKKYWFCADILNITIKYSSFFFNQWGDGNDWVLYLCECRTTCVFDVFHPLPTGGKSPNSLVHWYYQILHYLPQFFLCVNNCSANL